MQNVTARWVERLEMPMISWSEKCKIQWPAGLNKNNTNHQNLSSEVLWHSNLNARLTLFFLEIDGFKHFQ